MWNRISFKFFFLSRYISATDVIKILIQTIKKKLILLEFEIVVFSIEINTYFHWTERTSDHAIVLLSICNLIIEQTESIRVLLKMDILLSLLMKQEK